MKLTPSLENYLEVILDIETEDGQIRVTDIAETMNVSKTSVTKAINNLREANLVNQEKYGKLTLTEQGRCIAISIRKRHDILKRFLKECLKIDEDIAEEEACQMEHVISLNTIEKLEKFMSK